MFAEEHKENRLANPGGVGVLLCGQKPMCQAMTAMLQEQGVQQSQIHLILAVGLPAIRLKAIWAYYLPVSCPVL
jgi:NAD(P)H-flavin reductase